MESKELIVNISADEIYPHPENPRKELGDLTELSESIKKNGIMQNLTVIPGHWEQDTWKEDGYTTIIGHRRCGAAKQAGIAELPCRIVTGMTKKEQVSVMLEENMQRSDLTIYEQAQGFQMMLDLGETEESIAEKTGFSRSTVRHRLNIAKLDQNELQKKEQSDSFQLTLTDLYELEKVADVNERNKILKKATDSRNLKWMAQNKVREEKEDKNAAGIIAMLKEMGIKKGPKDFNRWDGKHETVKEIDLDKEPPKKINVKDKEKVIYVRIGGWIYLVKLKTANKTLTKEDEAEKDWKQRKKQIQEKMKQLASSAKDFVNAIISGKIAPLKDDAAIREKIWWLMLESGTGVYESDFKRFFTGKDSWTLSEEEREAAGKRIEALNVTEAMLIVLLEQIIKSNAKEITDYYGGINKERAGHARKALEILKPYGWSLPDEEYEKLLDGTHELYTKKD